MNKYDLMKLSLYNPAGQSSSTGAKKAANDRPAKPQRSTPSSRSRSRWPQISTVATNAKASSIVQKATPQSASAAYQCGRLPVSRNLAVANRAARQTSAKRRCGASSVVLITAGDHRNSSEASAAAPQPAGHNHRQPQ